MLGQDGSAHEAEASRRSPTPPPIIKPPSGDGGKPATEPSFVDLIDDYFKNSRWSNSENDLDLNTYFHPLRPNLADAYGLPGLQPIIKDIEQEDFLLVDDNKRFYTWNPNDGRLFRLKATDMTPREAADFIMNGLLDTDVQLIANPKYN